MKRPITPALLSFLLLASCQREAPAPATPAIPDAVAKSFQQAHPDLKSTGWEMEGGNVEIEFTANGVEVSELYDTGGHLLSTETAIDPSAMPQAVRDRIALDHRADTIHVAESIVSSNGTQYEVELRNGTSEQELIYAADGTPLGSEAEDAESEDAEDEH